MENLQFLLLFFGGLIITGTGLSITLGFGWALMIIEFISGTLTREEGYTNSQEILPPAKTKKKRLLGILVASVGIILVYFSVA